MGESSDSSTTANRLNRRRLLRYGGISGATGAAAIGGIWVEQNYDLSGTVARFLARDDVDIRDQVSEIDIDADSRIGFATDGHYSDHSLYSRNYETNHDELLQSFENEAVDLLLFGGDNICHPNENERAVAQELVDTYYSRVGVPFYGAHGNHDQMADEDWQAVYGHPKNHCFAVDNIGIIILDSADSTGSEIGPDVGFLRTALADMRQQDHLFILSHYWFSEEYDAMMTGPGEAEYLSEEAVALIHRQENVRGILHGHNHGENTGVIYDIEYDGSKKSYISGRIFGGINDSVAEGYWILEISGGTAAASFKTVSDGETRTAGYLL